MKQAVPWYFPSKIISVYVPNGRCTSRISIWRDDTGTSCLPTIPWGFPTNMNLFSKVSVVFPAVRTASATFMHMYHYRRNRLCHGDSSSLMWLSTTWRDFSVSLLWHGDDLAFFRLMWLKHGACNSQGPSSAIPQHCVLMLQARPQKIYQNMPLIPVFLCCFLFFWCCVCSFFCYYAFFALSAFVFSVFFVWFVFLIRCFSVCLAFGLFLFVRVFGFFDFLRVFLLFVVPFFLFCLLPCSSALSQVLLQQQQPKRKLQNNENNKSDKRSKSSEKMP